MTPRRVDGIGEPLRVFSSVLFAAVPVNAALAVYTFRAVRAPMSALVGGDGSSSAVRTAEAAAFIALSALGYALTNAAK